MSWADSVKYNYHALGITHSEIIMIKCYYCNKENDDNTEKCIHCGSHMKLNTDLTLIENFVKDNGRNTEEDMAVDVEILASGIVLVNRYEIDSLINSGGMGAIYKAYDLNLNRKTCVVKELLDSSLSVEQKKSAIRRFRREAEMLSTLRHKYLPLITDFFTTENRYYLVMEYIDGVNLAEYGEECGGRPDEKVITEFMMQVCEVLQYLHSQKPPIIYRDLKPANIMISKADGKVRLIDFGIARTLEGEYGSSTRVGTVGYASPEQYTGIPDARSDIFSLGVTMYSLMTGLPPNPGFSFESARKINPSISDRLNNIIMKAIRFLPEQRFQSAEEFYSALSGKNEVIIEDADKFKQLEVLASQLSVTNVDLKKQIIKSIGDLKISSAIGPLMATSKNDEHWEIRKDAILALQNFSDENGIITKQLCDIFQDEKHTVVRTNIIRVLAGFSNPYAFDTFLKALDDVSEDVQLRAIIALGTIKDKRALEPLFKILQDPNSSLQDDARLNIEKIDPLYLSSWSQERDYEFQKKNNLENIKLIFYICIFLIVCLLGFKFISEYINKSKIENEFIQGDAFLRSGDYKKAIDIFKYITEIKPDDAKGYYQLGRAYNYNEEPFKAIVPLSAAIKLDNKNPYYRIELGKTYLNIKKYDDALEELNKSISLNKNIGEAYLQLGILYAQTGKKDDALKNFQYCMNNFPELSKEAYAQMELFKPTNSDYYGKIKKIQEYLNLCQYDKAIEECNQFISNNKDSIDGYILRSQAYYYQENLDKASEDLKQALLLKPDDAGIQVNLAFISLAKKDYNYAIELANKSIVVMPSGADAYLVRGTAYFKLNQNIKAKDDLEEYIKREPTGKYVNDAKLILDKLKIE